MKVKLAVKVSTMLEGMDSLQIEHLESNFNGLLIPDHEINLELDLKPDTDLVLFLGFSDFKAAVSFKITRVISVIRISEFVLIDLTKDH